jgi:hypothetical protein
MDVALKPEAHSVARAPSPISLLPTRPSGWAQYRYDQLLALDSKERDALQLAALQYRFDQLKDSIPALERLANRQDVKRIESISDALPLFFDHRVYKSYPLSLIETRDFPKLTAWLNRLTLHDLLRMDLAGVKTLDDWCDRLDSYGMIIGHSTGTTGKLSFIPRSLVEWPAWDHIYNEAQHAATGVDSKKDFVPTFFPGYRGGHQMMMKMLSLFNIPAAGGPEHWHTLYQTPVSADLMSLAGRMQSMEDKGDLDRLIGPELKQKRDEMIAQGRRREQDVEAWFTKLISEFRGKRVKIGGTFADLTRVTLAGKAKGLRCDFAPGSFIMAGGGMKGYKDAPADWEQQVCEFFGVERICSVYGMSECTSVAPLCKHGFFHFMPTMIPILLDKDAKELPRAGVQTGRMALFDLLAETYWGGFISGDQITIHWDEDCPCGWKQPRMTRTITRFAEMEGGDDKITCAGSAQAYNEFMDYVMQV